MKISSIEYSFIDAFKSLKRNRSLSFASVATVAATLFIFGVFLLVSVNLNLVMSGVESQLEVKVTLTKEITSAQQGDIETTLKGISGVKTVTLETNDEALTKLRKQFGDKYKGLLDGMDKNNPLPFTFIVKVDKPEFISGVVKTITGKPGVDDVNDGQEVVKTVMTITRTVKIIGGAIFIILITVSFFLIGNTIKLTVYSRRREIGIMKYIGATDWFIRTPFIIEGVMLGIFGAILSDLILYLVYAVIYNKAAVQFTFIQLIGPGYIATTLLFEFLLVGVVIGISSSIVSVRKFLAV